MPYQPILLRLLHGAIAVLTFLALLTGFWVYNTYDRRWGSLPLPELADIQGIHGTIALTFLLILPFFALYSLHLGFRRLVAPSSFRQLLQVGKPVWWLTLQRFANTLMLVAVTLAVVTGRMMQEAWLPAGDISQPWYLGHLVAWLGVLVSLALHLLLGAKVGGISFLFSMFQRQKRDGDTFKFWQEGIQIKPANGILWLVEFLVIGGIFMAFILPLFSSENLE